MDKVAVLAITRNGIKIGRRLREIYRDWRLYVPTKFSDNDPDTVWFDEPTPEKIKELFKTNDALICLFSLGAVIRLVAPCLVDKKTDPAVIVIDDKANFVISVLSGHIGGANQLSEEIAARLDSQSVVTTAADVNKTIAVDLVGREFGWNIEDDSTVTAVSAHMVNGEKIAVFQDAGERNWWKQKLPYNVTVFDDYEQMKKSDAKACLIISDKKIDEDTLSRSVVYRPRSLVVGIGLHHDTSKDTIRNAIKDICEKFELSTKSIAKITSIKKPADIQSLIDIGKEMNVPVQYVERDDLALVRAPNPSDTVQAYEGTASVSEAAAMLVSGGSLVVEKHKFPPDLTIAIARI